VGHRAERERPRCLILLAVEDRRYYINVGYGLEAILPTVRLAVSDAKPCRTEARDYDGAVSLLTARVVDVIAKDAGVEITTSQPRRIAPVSTARVPTRHLAGGSSPSWCLYHRAGRAASAQAALLHVPFGGSGVGRMGVADSAGWRRFGGFGGAARAAGSGRELVVDGLRDVMALKLDSRKHIGEFVTRLKQAAETNLESMILYARRFRASTIRSTPT